MQRKRKTYENKVDEQFLKMRALLAQLTEVESGLMKIDADINYYRSIKQYLATNGGWGERRCA